MMGMQGSMVTAAPSFCFAAAERNETFLFCRNDTEMLHLETDKIPLHPFK